MCGMCGVFTFNEPVEAQSIIISKMIQIMKRRGPDDEGSWTDGKNCTLGFKRLAILDLSSAGHQPMTTRDGRYTLVYNGEVYNFKEIRKDLLKDGIQFRSSGDAEVVLQALIRWHVSAFKRFNGMFALAFYDTQKQQLLLARDPSGIKPLYYLLNAHGIVFGSQYDQIMAHPWAKEPEIDRNALSLYLRLGYIPAPYAILKNTHLLEAGSWLETKVDGIVKRGKFFEFSLDREPDLYGQEAYQAVDQAITEAVKRQLISDVPVGVFLSGGIDSPLVTAKAKVFNQEIQAFTIGVEDEAMDESEDAGRYAKALGVQQIFKSVTAQDALKMLEDVVSACGEPFGDYSIFPTMLVSRLAHEHGLKVMLSGDGGDELFWGYPKRFSSVIAGAGEFKKSPLMRAATWGMNKLTRAKTDYPSPRYHSIGEWYRSKHTRLTNVSQVFPGIGGWPENFHAFDYTGHDPDEVARWLRSNEFYNHLHMVLMKVDRASMHYSVEVRVPLLDKEVIKVAARVDWKSCLDLKSGIGKQPLRHSLKKHVDHQSEIKKGFSVPMQAWLQKELRPLLEEQVLNRNEICGEPIDKKLLRNIYNELPQQSNHAWWLWMLLSLALWEKKYLNA